MDDQTLTDAIAEVHRILPTDNTPWTDSDIPHPVRAVIFWAVATGQLVPLADRDAAVGAALAEAANMAFNAIAKYPLRTMLTNIDNATMMELAILALRPEATAALERALTRARQDAYRDGWRFAFNQCERTGSVPDPDYSPAALQPGDDPQTDYEIKLAQLKKDFPNGI